MNRIGALFALAAGILSSSASPQSNPPASQASASQSSPAPEATECLPAKALDDLAKALDNAISGAADKDRACMRQLFYPNSRLIPVGRTREGFYAPRVLTVDAWIDAVKKRNATFYERQVKIKTESFAHIAHLWSTYEIRPTPDGKATARGINSIQAVVDGIRWKVSQIVWQPETATETIPGQYLL
jgi:hypothetical protein